MDCPCCGQAIPENTSFRFDDAGFVVVDGRFARLSEQEAEILGQLHSAQGRTVSRETLHNGLYQVHADETEMKIVDVLICKIRRKLKPLDLNIQTVWGRGYRFLPTTGGKAE